MSGTGLLSDVVNTFPGALAAVVALTAIFAGALVQGSLGFGMGLVSIPVLAFMMPERLPQTVVLTVVPLGLLMLWHERDAIRPRLVRWLLVGRVLGVLPAVALLTVAPVRVLQVVFAVTTLAAVILMAANRVHVRVTSRSQLTAGTISGFVGTAAGFGGPPVALLYARRTGRELRATLALVMLVGNGASLVGYLLGGRLTAVDVALGGVFLVPTLLGLAVGLLMRRHLYGARLRRAVLLIVAASAVVLLGDAIRG